MSPRKALLTAAVLALTFAVSAYGAPQPPLAHSAHRHSAHHRIHPHACTAAAKRHHHHARHRAHACSAAAHVRHRHLHPTRSARPQSEAAQNAATLAAILATPCANTEARPTPANIAAVQAATLCLIDRERARDGELPLHTDADLAAAAEGHSAEMVGKDYFGHVSPNGLTPLGRVRATGYIPSPQDGYTIGENIAWGTLSLSTPQAIVAAWMNSPEHRANILEGRYRDTAIGIAPQAPASLAGGQPGAVYTQEFGVIVH